MTEQDPKTENVEAVQQQVDEVVDIMNQNMKKIIERDGSLRQLEQRAEILTLKGQMWQKKAAKLKKKHCWNNWKMLVLIGFAGLIILIITVATVTFYEVDDDDGSQNNGNQTKLA